MVLLHFAGALFAQFNGNADVNMGRGAIVIGLASIIIGDVICNALFRKRLAISFLQFHLYIVGGILYYILLLLFCG